MRQTYIEYLRSRIEFQALVGLWQEFDCEADIVIEMPLLIISGRGDLSIPCMQWASAARKNPKLIAETLKPYVEQVSGIERVEVVGGYLNIFFDRFQFLVNSL